MTPERWQRITEVFDAALARPPKDRLGFLVEACDGDGELQAEVESLLAENDRAGSFIQRPVLGGSGTPLKPVVSQVGATCFSDKELNVKVLGHYQVLEKLGEGGMGVVYKGRDTRLNRFVAIKVLPPESVTDLERKHRFVQEARAASALNHPNIITIHEIADQEGIDFMVMEYVQGKTLKQLIPRKGLPLGGALKYASQIADALAAAHAAGIVHRDLKPGNVMVTQSDLVKVLDFGLVKLTHKPEIGGQADSETLQETASLTKEGMILGTVSYMSPEQAEGKRIDARSDIFSFGSILYETLTGQKTFQGSSSLAILTAILREEPKPASEIVKDLPREAERIIARCLRKDPARRFQTMADLKVALEEVKETSDRGISVTTPKIRARLRSSLIWIAGLLLPLSAAVVIVWFLGSRTKEQELPLACVPLTTYPGNEFYPSFSPDGNQVAFSWNGAKQDNYDIYIKLIGPGEPLRLTTDPAEDYSPAWSPDGRFIAFLRYVSTGKAAVLLVPTLGGAERQLAEVSAPSNAFLRLAFVRDLSWSPDSKWLAVPDKTSAAGSPSLFLLSVETGEKQRLTSAPAQSYGDMNPAFAPDGHTLAFVRSLSLTIGDIYLLPLSESLTPKGEPKRLTLDSRMNWSPAWTADGREIVFAAGQIRRQSLWKIMASGSGKPHRLGSVGEYSFLPAISRHGHRLAYVRWLTDHNIGRLEVAGRDGKTSPPSNFISSTLSEMVPQYSPDGKKIAFSSDRSGNFEIWVCESSGLNSQQLTFFGGPDTGSPRWSPDGKQIAFDSHPDGPSDVYVINSEGGKPHRLTENPFDDFVPSWSREGKWIYFASNRTGDYQVWKMPAGGGEAVQVTRKGGLAAIESPDGKSLYYGKDLEFPTSLWKVPLDGGQEIQILDPLSNPWNFAMAKQGIYFLPTSEATGGVPVEFFSFATGEIKTVATVGKAVWVGLAASPDGRTILYTQIDQQGSDLMLVENFH